MLSNIRYFVDKKILLSVYFAIFHSHLTYASQVCGQNSNSIKRITTLQKKALRIISFEKYNAHTNPLFHEF